MKKTEVYSWRISPHMKSGLEEAARRAREPVAKLLERIVDQWLRSSDDGAGEARDQRRIRSAAARAFGKLAGGDPARSERARETVRARLQERRAR